MKGRFIIIGVLLVVGYIVIPNVYAGLCNWLVIDGVAAAQVPILEFTMWVGSAAGSALGATPPLDPCTVEYGLTWYPLYVLSVVVGTFGIARKLRI